MKRQNQKPYKKLFAKIPEEKRNNVISAAVDEFASRGFEKARISDIAKRAGISHGSIYTYFETKDDILRYIIEKIAFAQTTGFTLTAETGIREAIRTVLLRSFELAESEPGLIAVWLSLSFAYNAKFAEQITALEEEGIRDWQHLLREAVSRGELSPDLDLEAAAYMLDSVAANILRSSISEHERAKLRAHFGPDTGREEIIDRMLTVIDSFLFTG